MISGNDSITALLKHVFSERPAQSLDLYFTSALMDVRRAMAGPSQLIKEEALGRGLRVPKKLRSGSGLPPWESELLVQMFIERPVILIQGGSGCGKTSALSFIRHYCRSLPVEKTGIFNYPHFLLTIDLQDQPDSLKQKKDSEEHRDQQALAFLTGLVKALDVQMERTLSDSQLGKLFTKTFLDPDESGSLDLTTQAVLVRHQVGSIYSEIQMDHSPTWKTIKPVLGKIDSAHDQVVARYLMLQSLGEIQWLEQGRRLILVIDNIDPFPEYLQINLIRTLEAIAHGSATGHWPNGEFFSVVMFARLSTSTRHSGTLDGVSAHRVNFRAPDPADLVFFKLSIFLLDPANALGWDSISPSDRDEIIGRAWFLWERLANPTAQFSQVLSGLAGTNSRTGCKLAIWWLTSPRLVYRMASREIAGDRSISRPLGAALLLRLAHAVARGIFIDKLPAVPDTDLAVSGIVDQFFANLLGIMIDNRVVRKRGARAQPGSDVRAKISQSAREHMVSFLRDNEWRRVREIANAPVAEAVFEALETLGRKDIASDFAKKITRSLKERELVLQPKLDAIEPADHELAKQICLWLCQGATRGATSTSRRGIEADVSDLLPESIRLYSKSTLPNRWEAVSILVSPDSQNGRTSKSAVNVFSADGVGISPVALHVLCYLEEKENGLQGIVIRERLKKWGFSSEDITQSLMEMVTVDRRLIYSGVKDFTYELDGWFDTYHEVRITSAGSGYLNKVAGTPAYLQWALLGPAELNAKLGGTGLNKRLESGLGRLGVVLEGLKLVRADELRRVKKLVPATFDAQRSLSPLSWVFFRSLQRFIRDISGYKGTRQDDGAEMAKQFLSFARTLRSEYLGLFGVFPIDWDHCLAYAEEDFRDRFAEQTL